VEGWSIQHYKDERRTHTCIELRALLCADRLADSTRSVSFMLGST